MKDAARYEVTPDANGVISLRHDMGAMRVQVACLRVNDAGEEVTAGYLFHAAITADEIEVMTVPGSGVTAVLVKPMGDGT